MCSVVIIDAGCAASNASSSLDCCRSAPSRLRCSPAHPAGQETEAAADARLACQQILDDETRHFDWVITEGALWWRPADWQVQAEQIRVVVAQTRPNVDVRILPLDFQAPNFSSLLHDPRQRLVTADSLAEVRLSDQVDVVYQTKSTSSRGCSRLRWARRRAWRC